MNRYYGYSTLAHVVLFGALLIYPLLHRSQNIMIIDGFDYMGGGSGGAGGGGGGPKKQEMGQVVPAPQNIPIPEKPAPVQHATKEEDAWRVNKAPKTQPIKETPKPSVPVPIGETKQEERTNVVSRGVSDTTKSGDGGFDFGGEGKGKGPGVGIGLGNGSGTGMGDGFGSGFGSYLGILRRRIWQEWTQSPIYGVDQTCVVGLTVARSGDVSNIKLEKSSGNTFYDNVAMRAVRNSAPMPPLPSGFPNSEQRFRIAFRLSD